MTVGFEQMLKIQHLLRCFPSHERSRTLRWVLRNRFTLAMSSSSAFLFMPRETSSPGLAAKLRYCGRLRWAAVTALVFCWRCGQARICERLNQPIRVSSGEEQMLSLLCRRGGRIRSPLRIFCWKPFPAADVQLLRFLAKRQPWLTERGNMHTSACRAERGSGSVLLSRGIMFSWWIVPIFMEGKGEFYRAP